MHRSTSVKRRQRWGIQNRRPVNELPHSSQREGLNGPPSSERLRLEVSCWTVYRSGAPNETRTR